MKIDLFAMPAVPATLEERERLRPIGRSTERYQMMLDELRKLVILADELGVDAGRNEALAQINKAFGVEPL